MKYVVGILAGIGATGLFGAGTAGAADLSPPPPPPPVEVVNVQQSCIYARLDGGASFHKRPDVTKNGGAPFAGSGSDSALDEKIAERGFIEGGIGCQVSDIMRVEVTGGYRFKSSLKDGYASLDADIETYTTFVNVFWDITNYNGFTPYVGLGVGGAYNKLSNITLPATASGGHRWNLAYNVSAGLSYDLSQNVKLDMAYRFVDLGSVLSNGATPIKVKDLKAHEFKVGMRYQFGAW